MENDLSIRLRAYVGAAEPRIPDNTLYYADALASSRAASMAASAGIICSHPRELRGNADPGAEADLDLDALVADGAADGAADAVPGQPDEDPPDDTGVARWSRLPLRAGQGTLADLIKSAHE